MTVLTTSKFTTMTPVIVLAFRGGGGGGRGLTSASTPGQSVANDVNVLVTVGTMFRSRFLENASTDATEFRLGLKVDSF